MYDIEDELLAIERVRDVKIMLAVESGSRSWGFASDDSDHDVRFVYIRPLEGYLSLTYRHDTMDWFLTSEMDIVGWDVRKFLKFMRGSNLSVFEWLGSGTVYMESERFRDVRSLAARCFNPRTSALSYLGMAASTFNDIRTGKATLKRYLYVIRALMACRWSVETGIPAPTRFDDLKYATLDARIVPIVDNLLEMKRRGDGNGFCRLIPDLDEWIINEKNDLNVQTGMMRRREPPRLQEFDDVFLKLLGI